MKKEKSDLEQLLNALIEKGWKPRGRSKELYRNNRNITLHITIYDCDLNVYLDWWFMNEDKKSFRELVSKESWLWQFVCENGMVDKKSERYYKCFIAPYEDANDYEVLSDLEYRLIEASLRDESELEDFLLSNIVIKDEK